MIARGIERVAAAVHRFESDWGMRFEQLRGYA
jgi:hypothetical protein